MARRRGEPGTRPTAVGVDQGVAPPAAVPSRTRRLACRMRLTCQTRRLHRTRSPIPARRTPRPVPLHRCRRDDADRSPPPAEEKRKEPQETGAQARSQPPEEVQREAPETSAGRSGEPVEIRSGVEEESSPTAPGRPRRTARVPGEMRQPREAVASGTSGVAFAPSRAATRGSLVALPECAPIRGASYPDDPAAEPVKRVRLLPRVVPKWGEVPASEVVRAPPRDARTVPGGVKDGGYAADVRPRRGLPGPAPPEAPPITVTIGRVEVRAVPPAPEPPRRDEPRRRRGCPWTITCAARRGAAMSNYLAIATVTATLRRQPAGGHCCGRARFNGGHGPP